MVGGQQLFWEGFQYISVLTCLQYCVIDRVYEAEIEEIDGENATAAITFSGYGNAEVVPLQSLRAPEEGQSRQQIDGKPKSK